MITHSRADWDIAGRTLFGEARGEPFLAQVAVAWVIRNRAERPSWWGRDIQGVCLKDKQFSCWNDSDPNRERITTVTQDESRFRLCLGIVALVLSDDLSDPTDGATHYYTTAKPPWSNVWPPVWAHSLKFTRIIGAHQFLRDFKPEEHA